MSYSYERQKADLFTERGVEMLTRMRDKARELLKAAGAVRADKIMDAAGGGSSWTMQAALDYMVEKGDLQRVTAAGQTRAQHQVFVDGHAEHF